MIYNVSKYSTTNNNIHFKIITNNISTKYIYYYLYNNIKILEDGFVGANQKKISKEYIEDLDISIPTLRKQKKIVEYCEKNDELIKKLEEDIERNKNIAKEYLTNILNNSETEDIDV
jgi:type I restriction enzyme S subunit